MRRSHATPRKWRRRQHSPQHPPLVCRDVRQDVGRGANVSATTCISQIAAPLWPAVEAGEGVALPSHEERLADKTLDLQLISHRHLLRGDAPGSSYVRTGGGVHPCRSCAEALPVVKAAGERVDELVEEDVSRQGVSLARVDGARDLEERSAPATQLLAAANARAIVREPHRGKALARRNPNAPQAGVAFCEQGIEPLLHLRVTHRFPSQHMYKFCPLERPTFKRTSLELMRQTTKQT